MSLVHICLYLLNDDVSGVYNICLITTYRSPYIKDFDHQASKTIMNLLEKYWTLSCRPDGDDYARIVVLLIEFINNCVQYQWRVCHDTYAHQHTHPYTHIGLQGNAELAYEIVRSRKIIRNIIECCETEQSPCLIQSEQTLTPNRIDSGACLCLLRGQAIALGTIERLVEYLSGQVGGGVGVEMCGFRCVG